MAGDIFSQGLVPGIILLVYLVINKIIDSRKKDPLKDISKLLTIVTKDIIERDKEKSMNAIGVVIDSMLGKLYNYFVGTVINNNIHENREQVEYNCEHMVKSVFSEAYNTLNIYKGNNKYLNYYLNEQWKVELTKDILNIMYNDKLDNGKKIIAFAKRMEIRYTDYVAHITNNAFGNN